MLNVRSPFTAPRAREGGFTLIELMIAIAIVSILIAVALPTFNSSQRKSRRGDAFAALSAIQLTQERWRSNNTKYGATADVIPNTTSGSGYYSLSIQTDSNTATGYIALASAVSGKSQAADTGCTLLGVRMSEGNISYGSSGGSDIDWTDPKRCWAR